MLNAPLDLRTIAHALGGEISGRQVLAPGPGHSKADRSLAVKLAPGTPDGFVVYSHSNDDHLAAKDYVRSRLGMPEWEPNGGGGDPLGRMQGRAQKPRVVAEYTYRQANGTPHLKVLRYEPKGFKQQKWTGAGWAWGGPDGPKIPYRLPELLDAVHGTVFVCEGEKDANNVAALGLLATSAPEGAEKWTSDLNSHFSGRTIVVLQDNDEAGAKHARKVADELLPVAAEVRVLLLPALPPKGDVSDWIAAAGGTADDLVRLASEAPLYASGDAGGNRPVIRLEPGEIERVVDEAEAALIAKGGLYQRANMIVSVGEAPVVTADNQEVGAQRIIPRGEHALIEDLSTAAVVEGWNLRGKKWTPVHPPAWIVKTLQQRTGRLRFPVLMGVTNAPTLRSDGSLIDQPGYDAATGLIFDARGTRFPVINPRPPREDGERALGILRDLVSGFPFVTAADRSAALSAILTALVRPSLRSAPLHGFTAPLAGSGKSKLVDIASVITTGREAGVIAQGRTEEETEKRLGSLFLDAAPLISIDNCETPLGGEFLCQVLTQSTVRVRILGRSEAPELPTRAFIAATGNNLRLVGDMTRRALLCELDPREERPELRIFLWEPVARVKADRSTYVSAALTVLLAYNAAGRPAVGVTPLGSFEDWSLIVRNALLWFGEADPVETMERVRKLDPVLEDLSSVMTQWKAVIGSERTTVRRVIEKATEQRPSIDFNRGEFINRDFREALLTVAGVGGAINTNRLGKWLSAKRHVLAGGHRFEQCGTSQGVAEWRLVEVDRPPSGDDARPQGKAPLF
jgi:hypothetical protein